ncbi:hypothetical protein A3K80_01225 [Candidatus Bathyarchaeota archaeon RBG_13_38_9]|nr:MAG: hypothetical protein A3K80_01225 [Candidatus Bathyarchaeota archaeon RBG_13_38_9]
MIKINTLNDLEFINSKDKSGIQKQRAQGELPQLHFTSLMSLKKIIEVEIGIKKDVVKRFLN